MLLIHFMGANLNKNPETSKCFGTFFIKKYKNESELSFRSLNHDFDTFINIYTLAGCVDTLAIQVIPSVIVIRSL